MMSIINIVQTYWNSKNKQHTCEIYQWVGSSFKTMSSNCITSRGASNWQLAKNWMR